MTESVRYDTLWVGIPKRQRLYLMTILTLTGDAKSTLLDMLFLNNPFPGETGDPATDSASGAPPRSGDQTVKSEHQGVDSKPATAPTPQQQIVEQSNDIWVHWDDFRQAFKLVD